MSSVHADASARAGANDGWGAISEQAQQKRGARWFGDEGDAEGPRIAAAAHADAIAATANEGST